MHRFLVPLTVAIVALTCSNRVHAAEVGQVGGPPTLGGERVFPDDPTVKQLSEAIVIGRGDSFNGPIEIVAYDTSLGLCVDIDHPRLGGWSGVCGVEPLAEGEFIGIHAWGVEAYGRHYSRVFTELSGPLSTSAAAARVYFRRHHRRQGKYGIVAQPGRELLDRLHQHRAFGYYVGVARGCTPFRKTQAVALDVAGSPLGSARGFKVPDSGCRGWSGRSRSSLAREPVPMRSEAISPEIALDPSG